LALENLAIEKPANERQLDSFRARMERIFAISSKTDGYAPVAYLEILELFGLRLAGRRNLTAVF